MLYKMSCNKTFTVTEAVLLLVISPQSILQKSMHIIILFYCLATPNTWRLTVKEKGSAYDTKKA